VNGKILKLERIASYTMLFGQTLLMSGEPSGNWLINLDRLCSHMLFLPCRSNHLVSCTRILWNVESSFLSHYEVAFNLI